MHPTEAAVHFTVNEKHAMHQYTLSCEAPKEQAQQNSPDQVEAEKHLFGHMRSLVDLIPSPVRDLGRTGDWQALPYFWRYPSSYQNYQHHQSQVYKSLNC